MRHSGGAVIEHPERFPLASWHTIRREVAAKLRELPGAREWLVVAVALLVAGAGANVMVPRLLGGIVDIVAADAPSGAATGGLGVALARCGGLMALAAIVSALCQALGFYLAAKQAERVIAALREQMVAAALGLPLHEVEQAGSGDLVSRSTDDVAELSNAATETIPVLSQSVFMVGATVAALMGLNWQFLLVPLAVLPLYVIAGRNYLRRAPRRYAAEREAAAARTREILESIHGEETVRAFGLEGLRHRRIAGASTDAVRLGLRARTTMLTLNTWVTLCEFLLLAVALGVGFYLVRSDTLTVGEATAAVLMLVRVRGPVMSLMRVLDTVQSAYASLARIVGVAARVPRPLEPVGAPEASGNVELSGVTFSYGDAEPAVRDVDLSVRPGETVGIVGASGAGKTTVAALMVGLRVPDSGKVSVDGVEASRLSDGERAARLAMVSQDGHVFSGSLREDLTLVRPGAGDDELLGALERVGASWVNELPRGLDTEVGARGMQLDSVAAQQLALARILLVDPALVVLDEATAEAGSLGAGALEAAVREVTAGRSAVVIAHRLDQAAGCDRVVVMDRGRIVESGTHEELLSRRGSYERLWRAWEKGR